MKFYTVRFCQLWLGLALRNVAFSESKKAALGQADTDTWC
jgi:hypothetical protein